MSKKDWSDPTELERTWQAALVRIPKDDGGIHSMTMHEIKSQTISQGSKFPTIIFLHGCAGFRDSSFDRIEFPALNGFAVIAPNSFARKKYPQSCDFSTTPAKIALYRGTQGMREHDAAYAIKKAKALPWVDPNNLFLMGHSEGGLVVATFKSKNNSVKARIIEGWTCNSGWPEAKGLRAPKSEPVLALVGSSDPALQSNPYTKGHCRVNKKNGSKSIVYKDGNLSRQHDLLVDPVAQEDVLQFLHTQLK